MSQVKYTQAVRVKHLQFGSIYDEYLQKDTIIEGFHQYAHYKMRNSWDENKNDTLQKLDHYSASKYSLKTLKTSNRDSGAQSAQQSDDKRWNNNFHGHLVGQEAKVIRTSRSAKSSGSTESRDSSKWPDKEATKINSTSSNPVARASDEYKDVVTNIIERPSYNWCSHVLPFQPGKQPYGK